jgi:succinyl-CoA synthetase alpha subunit
MFDLSDFCKVLIQGIDAPTAQAAIQAILHHNGQTKVLAGVCAGMGGQIIENSVGNIPVFDLVEQAQASVAEIDVSIIFNPPWQVMDAALEAIAVGIERIIICSSGVPPLDGLEILRRSAEVLVLGSGSVGLLVPDRLLLGTFDASYFRAGEVGIISRSQSLIYEAVNILQQHRLGQSVVVHLGSDAILGSTARDWLKILSQDPATTKILLLGDILIDEEIATMATKIDQQVVAYCPRLTSNVAPLSDAAMLLRAGRRSIEEQMISPTAPGAIISAKSIFEIGNLLTVQLTPAS